MAERIYSYKELHVYQNAMDMRIFELTKQFPPDGKYSLTDQIRRSSRSVCANTAEAWRKRRHKAAFISKLNDAEGEACETQVWIEIAQKCKYMDAAISGRIDAAYEQIIGQLVKMISEADKWLIK